MSDVIVLSDSEDDFQPPSKKLKLNKSNTIKETNDSSNCYIVLDEEDEDKEKDVTFSKPTKPDYTYFFLFFCRKPKKPLQLM